MCEAIIGPEQRRRAFGGDPDVFDVECVDGDDVAVRALFGWQGAIGVVRAPDQDSWGLAWRPPGTPNMPESCAGGSARPSCTRVLVLVTVKLGTSDRRAEKSLVVIECLAFSYLSGLEPPTFRWLHRGLKWEIAGFGFESFETV